MPPYYGNQGSQNPFKPGTQQYDNWEAQFGSGITWAKSQGTEEKPYAFDADTAFGKGSDMLDRYMASLPSTPAKSPDLTAELKGVGPYQGYDWGKVGAELKAGYKPPIYKPANYLAGPDYEKSEYESAGPYEKTNFDFADRYQAPDEYEAFNFTQPDVAELSSVQPMSDEVWSTKKQIAADDVNDRYKAIAQRTRDELIRTGGRPEQTAAVMSNIEFEKEKAIRDEQRKIAIEEASQKVGIAQKEQELGLQRGLAVAGMDAETQERMANELAKTYGMSVDSARYMVEQQAKQQAAQSGENQAAYQFDTGEARYGAEFGQKENQAKYAADVEAAKRKTDFDTNEARYGYEQGTEAARYQSAMDQWTKEQQAAEAEKVWQSKYGLAQDVTQAKQSQWQADQAAKIDLWNAQMQGIGAAQTGAAQQGTYWGNLEKGERNDAKAAATPYYQYKNGQATGKVAYGGAGSNTPPPTTVQPSTKTQVSGGAPAGYGMPAAKKAA